MPDSNKIVKKLLETDIVDWQAWPEFESPPLVRRPLEG